jgi:glycerate 2-kinase
LLISDVPGDSPGVVGSGPTVVDRGATAQAALAVVERYRLDLPDNVRSALTANVPTSALPDNQSVVLIATAQKSLEAAARHAQALGVRPLILGDAIAGEAQQVAQDMADIVRQIPPDSRPCVLLSGGETSVTLDAVSAGQKAGRGARGAGRGGRNAEFLLALAVALEDCQGVCALACDTDGIDGSEDNAGAIVDSTTFLRADERGIDPREHLVRHDSYGFFAALDDLVVTGPTLTNVNDFRAVYLAAPTH